MKTFKFWTGLLCVSLALPAFSQVTFSAESGLVPAGGGGSDCVVDMNGDKLDDVVRVSGNTLYINHQQADGSFVQSTFSVAMNNSPSWSICASDLDENGYTDLLFGGGSAVSFIMANDDGTAYTEQLMPDYIFSQRSTFSDIDLDGDLDAFVCHDVDESHPYRNDGNGNMVEDQSLIATIPIGGNYAAIWCDYDNDGDQDMYISKCRGGAPVGDPQRINGLYRNNGDGSFTEVGAETNMDDGDQSWTTVFEDFDNDGDFDAFTVNHQWANRFMENNGDGTFTDIIGTTGINANDLGAWNLDAGDFDNNGFVDIFSEMNESFYFNNGDGTFSGVNGIVSEGGIGDLNNDGFLDVYRSGIAYINNGNDNNWVKFNLEGVESNAAGVGARIEIYGDWGIQIREVRAGESFSPMSSLTTHFGLGQAAAIDQVIIKWPSGIITVLDELDINTTYDIPEFGCLADPVSLEADQGTMLCEGQTVTLTAPAGFVAYNWSNGETTQSIVVNGAGGYSCNCLLEDDCIALSNTIVVQEFDATPPVIDVDGDLEFCEGNETILTAPQFDTYMWSNGADTQSITVSESGNYYFTIETMCGDIVSEEITVVVDDMPEPIVDDVTISSPQTVLLEATGTDMAWYDVAEGGTPIGFGDSFETEILDQDATFYVQSQFIVEGDQFNGGMPDNSVGSGGIPATGGYLEFTADEDFTLLEVTVYNEGNVGNRTVQLYNSSNQLVEEAVFMVDQSPQTLTLNFDVTGGDNYSLRCLENNLYRNSFGANYPYALGDVGAITGVDWNSTTYYYFFYDWKIVAGDEACYSQRVPVQVSYLGIEELENSVGLSMYPVPVNDMLTLNRADAARMASVEVVDITGKVVANTTWKQGATQLLMDLDELAPATYFIQYTDGEKTVHQQLLVQ